MVDRGAVLAFRATGHHLGSRLPADGVLDALAGTGIRDVKGSGLLALHARVEGVGPDTLDELRASGAAVEVVGARGTATLVPATDVAVFTVGTLPADEASLRARLQPLLPVLDQSGHTATSALDAARGAAAEALAGGPLDIGALSGALTRARPELSPMCRGRCGVHHIDQGLFDLVGESGIWRHDRSGGGLRFVAMEVRADLQAARDELVRRYLRCYGPSTPAQFAEWCGIGTADAAASLERAATVEVERRRYVLEDDLDRLQAPPLARGVRLLPPRDPYLLDRDRATLVPDRGHRRRVWRAVPVDGLVLADGVPVASWRPRRRRQELTVAVEPCTPLSGDQRAGIGREADAIAPLLGCGSAEVHLPG